MYPIVYLAVSNRILDTISRSRRRSQSFITNEEVQIFSPSLSMQMTSRAGTTSQERRLVCNRGSSRARTAGAACWALGRDGGGEHERRGVVAGKT